MIHTSNIFLVLLLSTCFVWLCVLVRVLQRNRIYLYMHLYREIFFFLWGLAHVVMEAKKSHDVMSANWRTRKAVVQLNPNEMPWESGSWWCKSLPEAENTRFRGTNVQGRTWILQVKQSEWIFPPSTFSFNSSTQQVGWCPLSLESNLLCTVYWFKW